MAKKNVIGLFLLFLTAAAIAAIGDFDDNGKVDGNDLSIFAGYWLDSPDADPNCDINADGTVNFVDYVILADAIDGGISSITRKMTVIVVGDGTVVRDPNLSTYPIGSAITLTATPSDSNSFFASYSGAGSSDSAIYTFTMPTIDCDITATFLAKIPSIPSPPDVNTFAYDDNYCYLTATDNDGDDLQWYITSLPVRGFLSGSQVYEQRLTSSMLPYRIAEDSNLIVYRACSAGADSFKYKVYDGTYWSAEGTVDIVVHNKQLDALTFDGTAGKIAVIPDGDYKMQLVDGRGMQFYFRTLQENCGLFNKRSAAGGYEAVIDDGFLVFHFYDANGLQAAVKLDAENEVSVNTGRWYAAGFGYNSGDVAIWLFGTEHRDIDGLWSYDTSIPDVNYASDANFVAGAVAGYPNLVGELDRIRWYDNAVGEVLDMSLIFSIQEGRAVSGVAVGLSGNVNPIVRFMLDEGEGETITDDKASPNIEGITTTDWLAAIGNIERDGDDIVSSRYELDLFVPHRSYVLNPIRSNFRERR